MIVNNTSDLSDMHYILRVLTPALRTAVILSAHQVCIHKQLNVEVSTQWIHAKITLLVTG